MLIFPHTQLKQYTDSKQRFNITGEMMLKELSWFNLPLLAVLFVVSNPVYFISLIHSSHPMAGPKGHRTVTS